MMKKYWEPVPKKYRKLGDSILIFSVGIQPLLTTLPLEDVTKVWLNFFVGFLGLVGKLTTNFFSEPESE